MDKWSQATWKPAARKSSSAFFFLGSCLPLDRTLFPSHQKKKRFETQYRDESAQYDAPERLPGRVCILRVDLRDTTIRSGCEVSADRCVEGPRVSAREARRVQRGGLIVPGKFFAWGANHLLSGF